MSRPRKKPRPGRLKGADLQSLRLACYERDNGICHVCGRLTQFGLHHYWPQSFHMAHKRNKRMWGDTLENVQTECGACHRAYHQNGPSMQKPVPAKEQSHEQ